MCYPIGRRPSQRTYFSSSFSSIFFSCGSQALSRQRGSRESPEKEGERRRRRRALDLDRERERVRARVRDRDRERGERERE